MSVSYKLNSTYGHPIHLKAPNQNSLETAAKVPNIRCPHCMHLGAFTSVLPADLQIQHVIDKEKSRSLVGTSTVGVRVCLEPGVPRHHIGDY